MDLRLYRWIQYMSGYSLHKHQQLLEGLTEIFWRQELDITEQGTPGYVHQLSYYQTYQKNYANSMSDILSLKNDLSEENCTKCQYIRK